MEIFGSFILLRMSTSITTQTACRTSLIKSPSRLSIIGLYASCYITLILVYKYYIHPYWGYYGFPYDVVPQKLVLGGLFTLVTAAVIPKRISRPSDLLLHVQFLVPIVPMFAMVGMANQSLTYATMVFFAFLVFFY